LAFQFIPATVQRKIRNTGVNTRASSPYHIVMVYPREGKRKDSAANRECLFSELSQKRGTPHLSHHHALQFRVTGCWTFAGPSAESVGGAPSRRAAIRNRARFWEPSNNSTSGRPRTDDLCPYYSPCTRTPTDPVLPRAARDSHLPSMVWCKLSDRRR
jgi:hypothetical protein